MTGEQFSAFVSSEVTRWRAVAQAAGVQPE